MNRTFISALGLAAALAAATTAGSFAQTPPETRTGVAVTPPRLEIGVEPGASTVEAKLSITNLGSQQQQVNAALDDLIVTGTGAYDSLPAGATGYSVSQDGGLSTQTVDLGPTGSADSHADVTLSVNVDGLSAPRYGSILVKPVVDAQPDPSTASAKQRFVAKVEPAVLVPVIIVPLGENAASADVPQLASSVHLGLQPAGIDLHQKARSGGLDGLIPVTLPKVADHGALEARIDTRNTGDVLGRAFSHAQFTQVHPLSWLPAGIKDRFGIKDTVLLEEDTPPGAAMPGNIAETVASTEIDNQQRTYDAAPWIGLVRVTATTHMTVADVTSEAVTEQDWMLIVPWKELGAVLLAFLAYRNAWRVRRYFVERRKPE